MKFLPSLALAVLALGGISSSANAQRFEGLIVYRIESGAGVITQKSWVRGDSVVIEAQAPMPDKSFANFASKEFRVAGVPDVMTLKDFDPDHKKTNHLVAQPGTKNINGKEAQLYTIEIVMKDTRKMTTSFWLTPDYPENVRNTIVRNMLIGNDDPVFREIATEIKDMGKAPVALSVNVNEKETMSMEIVTINEQTIPLEKFSL